MDIYIIIILLILILFVGGMVYHIEKKKDFHLSKVLNYILLILLVGELILMGLFYAYGLSLCAFTKKLFCR